MIPERDTSGLIALLLVVVVLLLGGFLFFQLDQRDGGDGGRGFAVDPVPVERPRNEPRGPSPDDVDR